MSWESLPPEEAPGGAMFNKPISVGTESKVPEQAMPQLCRSIECRTLCVLGGALSGFWIAHGVTEWSTDPSTRNVTIWTGTLTVVSLAALVIGIRSLLTSAQSRLRHVFCGRRIFVFGVFLAVVAITIVVMLMRRQPFGQLAARGQLTAVEIVDVGLVFAAIVTFTGAIIAFFGAADAYREERSWHRFEGARRQ